MKNLGKLFCASIAFLSFTMSLLAVNPIHGILGPNNPALIIKNAFNSPVGTWDYTVADVPFEYSAGVLVITEEKKEFKVAVKVNYNTLTASEVKVNKNKVDFAVFIEGGKVQVSLEFKDDVIIGNANSAEGKFLLKGKRNKS